MPSSFRWFGDDIKREVASAAERGLFEGGSYLLDEANRTIPYQEGVMAGSGEVQSDATEAVISYDTPYTVEQHEDVTKRHAAGRRAKWLELTLQERGTEAMELLARSLRAAF